MSDRTTDQRSGLKNQPRYVNWLPCGRGLSARIGFRVDRDGQLVPTHIEVRSTTESHIDTPARPITATALREVSIPALMRAARREMANRPDLWPEAQSPRKSPGPASHYTVPADVLLERHAAAQRGFKLLTMRAVYASYGCPLPENEASARRQLKRDIKRAREVVASREATS